MRELDTARGDPADGEAAAFPSGNDGGNDGGDDRSDDPPGARAVLANPQAAYRWFGAGVGSWGVGFGIQSVIFAHLLTNELGIGAAQLGVAQSVTMLPTLAFLLVGGAFVDRRDPRRVLVAAHLLSALPVLALAAAAAGGALSYGAVMLQGCTLATIGAFAVPARDSQLSHVARGDMLRAVTGMTILQFAATALGSLLGGEGTRQIGAVETLGVQAVLLAGGALFMLRIPPSPPIERPARSTWHDIAEGIREVARTPELRAPVLLVLAVGTCFIGPFVVVFPLIVRDLYQGGARELGWVMAMFPLGTISGSLVLRAFGVRRRGLASMLALLFGSATLIAIARDLPFAGMLVATALWGVSGAVFINCTRAMFQEAAPAAHRARCLSVFQLAFTGAAPAGAALARISSGAIGTLATLDAYAGTMIVIVGLIWTLTPTRQLH